MASEKQSAEKKFWRTRELVENALLPFLDLESVEQLAKAHDLTVEILGKTFTWNKLVKRTFPLTGSAPVWTDVEEKSKARSLAGFYSKSKALTGISLSMTCSTPFARGLPGQRTLLISSAPPLRPIACHLGCSSCLRKWRQGWGRLSRG